ncbi:fluoride efflux transporter family protein [uncultured Corynebacterium sp.]|uniref:fluoride efflux transporter family protein n=1 Tax=uncultured Corynebacterium sp. TaxID=159447 RepID=UPI0025E77905|nr:fluoride efflux transporter family protein [uncultured Corynebacterium sp.]
MKDAALVGSGAALGAVARFLLSALLGGGAWPLLLINILGSAAMGYVDPPRFWGTGFLGGFTSFATFAFLSTEMSAAGAAGYVAATVVGCVGAWLLADATRGRRA